MTTNDPITPATLESLLRELAALETEDTIALLAAGNLDSDPEYQRLQMVASEAQQSADRAKEALDTYATRNPEYKRRLDTLQALETKKQAYKEALKQYAQANGSRKPFQGSGLAVYQDAEVTVTDEAAALWWLRSNMPICLKVDMGILKKFAPQLKTLGLPWLTVTDGYRVSIPDLTPWRNSDVSSEMPEWLAIVYSEKQVDPVTGEIRDNG